MINEVLKELATTAFNAVFEDQGCTDRAMEIYDEMRYEKPAIASRVSRDEFFLFLEGVSMKYSALN